MGAIKRPQKKLTVQRWIILYCPPTHPLRPGWLTPPVAVQPTPLSLDAVTFRQGRWKSKKRHRTARATALGAAGWGSGTTEPLRSPARARPDPDASQVPCSMFHAACCSTLRATVLYFTYQVRSTGVAAPVPSCPALAVLATSLRGYLSYTTGGRGAASKLTSALLQACSKRGTCLHGASTCTGRMYPVRSAQYLSTVPYRSARTLTRSSRCAALLLLCLYLRRFPSFRITDWPCPVKTTSPPVLSLFFLLLLPLIPPLFLPSLSLPYPLIPSSIPPLPLPTLRVGRFRSFGLGLRRIESPDRLPLEDEPPSSAALL
ncbi:hypothetical protein CFAM422_011215 [Trichoderma lentiforme]|uniref:Uncharacterized protein n=1 Tax=Trichoderma lentiforme TaxID=1567552 RepID=A0A9P4X6B7_9HYPO|nr:hypothetical protein CFAM422_011215 [Trichoderma lentiforme]